MSAADGMVRYQIAVPKWDRETWRIYIDRLEVILAEVDPSGDDLEIIGFMHEDRVGIRCHQSTPISRAHEMASHGLPGC